MFDDLIGTSIFVGKFNEFTLAGKRNMSHMYNKERGSLVQSPSTSESVYLHIEKLTEFFVNFVIRSGDFAQNDSLVCIMSGANVKMFGKQMKKTLKLLLCPDLSTETCQKAFI